MPRKSRLAAPRNPFGFKSELGEAGPPKHDPVGDLLSAKNGAVEDDLVNRIPPALRAVPGALSAGPVATKLFPIPKEAPVETKLPPLTLNDLIGETAKKARARNASVAITSVGGPNAPRFVPENWTIRTEDGKIVKPAGLVTLLDMRNYCLTYKCTYQRNGLGQVRQSPNPNYLDYELVSKVSQTPIVGHGCKTLAAMEQYAADFNCLVKKKAPLQLMLPSDLDDKNKVRVTLMKDTTLKYPELGLDVFVAGAKFEEQAFASMFARTRSKRAKSLLEADLVIFTGGSDLNPTLYGEEKHAMTQYSNQRDDQDMQLYVQCLAEGIPMFGVCRGAQFLHVMNGGKLYQHVDNHNSSHEIWDVRKKIRLNKVSSVHHQMCIPNNDGFSLIATANVASNRWKNPTDNVSGDGLDVEAFWYRDTCSIGVQGHPEYAGYHYYTKWCLDLIDDLVVLNPDIEWRKPIGGGASTRRMKAEFILERNARLKAAANALS